MFSSSALARAQQRVRAAGRGEGRDAPAGPARAPNNQFGQR